VSGVAIFGRIWENGLSADCQLMAWADLADAVHTCHRVIR
jgi:hypothetical protein